jgi:hypothetical protein
MKPIIFNTKMVRAILEGRKTVTRRVIKPQPNNVYFDGTLQEDYDGGFVLIVESENGKCEVQAPPYQPEDVLWVRETWCKDVGRYMYRANYAENEAFYRSGKEVRIRWRPSIHMPKEAARLFLMVKAVRAERLKHCGNLDAKQEGCSCSTQFVQLWDSTIKKADLPRYGWEANPWVWVIEFERISKEEVTNG